MSLTVFEYEKQLYTVFYHKTYISNLRLTGIEPWQQLARWLKSVLELSGINSSIFKAHSFRGAAASAAFCLVVR
jgi:hypothetical protein